jgi:CRP-like cAMP-binding protein
MGPNGATISPDSLAERLLAVAHPSRVIRHRVSHGASIFRQGDPATAVFVLESGRARLARVLADGAQLILHVVRAGESFAEASLSAPHYHCDAIAETDAVVLAVPKADLLAALASDPVRCLALTLALATQVRDLRARLELRNIRSARERVLAWLHSHASGAPLCVALGRSWTQIADELGLTREAVYRVLARLERERRIGRGRDVVYLEPSPGETWSPAADKATLRTPRARREGCRCA